MVPDHDQRRRQADRFESTQSATQIRTITSPASYNDGRRRHLAVAAVPSGTQQATSGVTTRTGDYAGGWRVGHGKARGTLGITTTSGLPGQVDQVDQVAVYRTAHSSTRVQAHYAAR